MVSWEYYSRRRNVELNEFMKGRKLKTYEDYVEELKVMKITPMSLEKFKNEFVEQKDKKVEPKPAPKPAVRKKRKYTRRKKQ